MFASWPRRPGGFWSPIRLAWIDQSAGTTMALPDSFDPALAARLRSTLRAEWGESGAEEAARILDGALQADAQRFTPKPNGALC